MGEEAEVRELLEMLGRVERYIRYLHTRASGDTYVAFGLAVAIGSIITALADPISTAIGVPIGLLIGLTWMVVMSAAVAVSARGHTRLVAFIMAHEPPEERERRRAAWRRGYLITALGWIACLSLWSFIGLWLLSGEPGPTWSLYLVFIGLGNLVIYLATGRGVRETLYVALALLACSPVPLALACLAPWAAFAWAVLAVVASYLWAGLRFYGKAEALLAGAEG
ncbi:hypothetical protein DRO33_00165 [Candidatus Bathyarchaeota archaeon]|nr:MAG: hypothetical protein DRO33_00165 [Candidatus Bathyarchaeota archaeon]